MSLTGVSAQAIGKQKVADACPNCGATNQTALYLYQEYSHFMGIPIFSKGKLVGSECAQCKTVLDAPAMPASWRPVSEALLKSRRTPFWIYAGRLLLLSVIALVIYTIIADR